MARHKDLEVAEHAWVFVRGTEFQPGGRTRVVRSDHLGRGGEPGLGVHAHARVVARPQAVALHPVLHQLRGHLPQ